MKAEQALGVLAPIVTPCTLSGAIDGAGLCRVCDDMLGAGVDALFVMGSTGRGPWFGLRERCEVCRTVAGHAGAGVSLFAGCMDSGLPRMVENSRAMADSGAQYAVVTAPVYFSYSQQEIEAIFLRFADASSLPVMIYDIPAFAGVKLDMNCVVRLAEHGNVIGVKDSSNDLARFKQIVGALEHVPGLWLLQGKEPLLLDSLRAGASGFVVSMLHFMPRPFVELYQAVRTGDDARADGLQARITRVYDLVKACLERRAGVSMLFQLLDSALRRRQVCDNILMAHEGDVPAWVEGEAERAVRILAGEQ